MPVALTLAKWRVWIIFKLFAVTLQIIFENILTVHSDIPWIYLRLHAKFGPAGLRGFSLSEPIRDTQTDRHTEQSYTGSSWSTQYKSDLRSSSMPLRSQAMLATGSAVTRHGIRTWSPSVTLTDFNLSAGDTNLGSPAQWQFTIIIFIHLSAYNCKLDV